jgi:uncharacterized protein (TIGR01777 family)
MAANSTIVIAGGSGFIGRRLAAQLTASGHDVTILTRYRATDVGNVRFVTWSPDTAGDWAAELEGAAALVNLCGESIGAGRWTESRKQALRNSRVLATTTLVNATLACATPPGIFLQASGVGFYGTGDDALTESSPPGDDFLATLAVAWEAPLEALTTPAAILRFGVVLGRRGGALAQMLLPFRFFVGGPIASGNQWLSWIHLEDAVAAIQHLLDFRAAGIFNVTTPNPVRNHEFASAAGQALGRPTVFPVPRLVLKMLLGEQATLVCDGQRALPRALEARGFTFAYPTISAALENLTRT